MKVFLAMKKYGEKDLEDPTNFPQAKMVLTVMRIGSGSRQVWGMIEEAKKTFQDTTPIITTDSKEQSKLKHFCAGRSWFLCTHPSIGH